MRKYLRLVPFLSKNQATLISSVCNFPTFSCAFSAIVLLVGNASLRKEKHPQAAEGLWRFAFGYKMNPLYTFNYMLPSFHERVYLQWIGFQQWVCRWCTVSLKLLPHWQDWPLHFSSAPPEPIWQPGIWRGDPLWHYRTSLCSEGQTPHCTHTHTHKKNINDPRTSVRNRTSVKINTLSLASLLYSRLHYTEVVYFASIYLRCAFFFK